MARPISEGRMIQKKISESDKFAALSPHAAVLFCLIIPHLNPHGKAHGGPAFVKEEICPKIVYLTVDNLPGLLKEISNNTNVKWFKCDGRYWIHSLNFLTEHQKLKPDKMGNDSLPNYSRTTPELLKSSGTSLIKEEDEVKDEVKGEVKGPTQPVDNSFPKFPVFDEPTEPEKEKAALKEKPKTETEKSSPPMNENVELRELIAQVKVKHPRLAIDTWYGKNIRAHPEAIIHVLKSLMKSDDNVEYPLAYLQSALNVEDGKFNARDGETEHQARKRATGTEVEMLGAIMSRALAAKGENDDG